MDIAIVVITSDGYASLLDGFFYFFEKFNTINDLKVYVGLETTTMKSTDNVYFITTNKNSWSERLHFVLKRIVNEYVYILPEDFFLMHEVDKLKFNNLLKFAKQNNADFICPMNSENSLLYKNKSNGIDYYQIKNSLLITYRYLYAGSGIYNKLFLMSLLRKNENIWEFENNSSFRVNPITSKNFRYQTKTDPFGVYPPGIIFRGTLTKAAQDFLKIQEYKLIWQKKDRLVITSEDNLLTRLSKIPSRYIKRVTNIFLNRIY